MLDKFKVKVFVFYILTILILPINAYADELKGKGKKFEQNKAWIIEQTNKKTKNGTSSCCQRRTPC